MLTSLTTTKAQSFIELPAQTLVINAEIYTLAPEKPWAEAFVYDADGTILAIGSETTLTERYGSDSTIIDLNGQMILPGFQDTHVHVPEAGINESLCLLPATADLSTYETLIKECAVEQADSSWVRAAGVSLFELRNTRELPIDVLDRAVADRPVIILDDLGHAVWTNSAGLRAAEINQNTPDPQGGIIHRNPRSKALTGLLLEDAQQLVRNAAAPDSEAIYNGLLSALQTLAENGITTVSDAGGYWMQNHDAAWQRAADEGTLSVRAANSLYLYPALDKGMQLTQLRKRFDNNPDDWLRFDTAKIYLDGILDLGTAAMISPYHLPVDENYPSGFNYFQTEKLHQYVQALHDIGYRMHFHVIGDRATREALDSIENINGSADAIRARRHRTTHTYLVHPDDIPRFRSLGVIADFQVGADSTDIDYHHYLAEFIGDRAYDLLPVNTLLEGGASVTLSSDWDADPLSPLGIIENALTRASHNIDSLETAIRLVTLDAAFALGHDNTTGSLEAGKFADFVVLDRNIFDVEHHEISEAKVLMTFVGGHRVYQAD
ncbi:hypothetical protein AB833_14765 [Chromatiales bacterium (ex Bugula neritina AB1)]|nr:hypothetical protein AB833_14765 [Chromatiales bacterium (ex Bugula neritina AB1)]